MTGTPPIQTTDIFERLSKGQFISEDSGDDEVKDLFNIIELENNYEILKDYFQRIGFILEKGSGYYYFSRKETNQILEDKVKRAYKWIDILDFFNTYAKAIDEPFSQGTIFSPSRIFEKSKVNSALQEKLEALKNYQEFATEKPLERIQKLSRYMVKETFFDLANEYSDEFKVLASYRYLQKLVVSIVIEEEEDETFE
jgi:hypothetical protein